MQNKIEPKSDNDNPSSFEPKLVSELQDGTYKFRIPSYQRGYRWSDQEVSDLLDDLCTFVNTVEKGVYFLQPLVVRPLNGEWEVLDGQQRLTTMLLVLNRFIKRMPEEDREEYVEEEVFCYALRNQIGVLVDGTVVPCCLDHEGNIALGNLFEHSLEEIMESPRAKAMYDGFSKHIATEPLCRRCGYAAVSKRFRKEK